jgi:hypothetical protein
MGNYSRNGKVYEGSTFDHENNFVAVHLPFNSYL